MPPLHETKPERTARLAWEAHAEECEHCPEHPERCGAGGALKQTYEYTRVQEQFARPRD